ncbi:MAG: hypothetical protein FJ387_29355 [Verrucomicrobia bacterium]|nr:hypothetical protein [Verrucomicrobiota bacterium]
MISTASPPEAVKERWRTAGRFVDVLEAEVKARTNAYGAGVVSWLKSCRLGQDVEEGMLLAERPTEEDKPLHRALLAAAIASGEALLLEDAPADALASLRLTVDGVRAKLERWPTELRTERQAALFQQRHDRLVTFRV